MERTFNYNILDTDFNDFDFAWNLGWLVATKFPTAEYKVVIDRIEAGDYDHMLYDNAELALNAWQEDEDDWEGCIDTAAYNKAMAENDNAYIVIEDEWGDERHDTRKIRVPYRTEADLEDYRSIVEEVTMVDRIEIVHYDGPQSATTRII